jgi:haloacetate dehalogenase
MAADLLRVMEHFGFTRFNVAGHDRGGRVAYRMALDHPDRVDRLAVLDVLPGETVWIRATAEFALNYWPWSLLAQPTPLPEAILESAAEAIVSNALGGWGTPVSVFPPAIREAYVRAIAEPHHAHAICEEYRAGASIDREHDRADVVTDRRIKCPILALWSEAGALGTWYGEEGGPLALWRQWGADVSGRAVNAGHFFPEEIPKETAAELQQFFAAVREAPTASDGPSG